MKLIPQSFAPGQSIPKLHTGQGADQSPAIQWIDAPKTTQSFALICDDPDAPTPQPWVHWLIWNLPAHCTGLPQGVERKERLDAPKGALQGRNSWNSGNIGYRGPMPPPGKPHRYFFKLYALDAPLAIPPSASKETLLAAMKGHVLAEAQTVGLYQR
jgi:hypothetical protein